VDKNLDEKSERKRRFRHQLLLLVGVVCAIILVLLSRREQKNPSSQHATINAVPVETEKVRRGEIPNVIQALGTVTPVYTVTIFSRVQGQIMAVNYREGQIVKKGDSLLEIDPLPYEAALLQAEGALAHDRGLLQEAKIDLVRYRKAWKQNAIQKQLLDDQEQIVIQDEGTVRADEGVLKGAQANLSYCHIASPIDGRVGLRLVDPGNMVQANSTTPLVVVAQLDPITVIFSVAEDFLSVIQEQLRQGATMKVDAYDRAQEKTLSSGKFLSLDNQIDATTGTVRVRALFDNKDGALFPNQFVNARLQVNVQQGALLISTSAVQRGAQGPFVYVIQPNETAHMQPVKVGTISGEITAAEGVQSGDEIAVSGFDRLQDGAKVVIQNEHELAGSAAPARSVP
jgi:multidrug efflux system membrane fusion protein